MSWFRLDDQGAFHEKVLTAGNEAYGAWCRAGQWSSGHRTEGRIPRSTAITIARQHVWQKLVDARLCESLGDDGWQIHDFLDWNPAAEAVEAKREARAAAGRRGGLTKAANAKHGPSKRLAIASDAASKRPANAKQKSTPSPSPSPSPEEIRSNPCPASRDQVGEIWDHYVQTVKRYRPRRRPTALTPKDGKAIAAHLRAGHTVEDLKRAVDGLFHSPHHLGMNNRNTEYLELEYALRKPATFIALADDADPAPQTGTRPALPPIETVDPALIDAELAKLDARFAS